MNRQLKDLEGPFRTESDAYYDKMDDYNNNDCYDAKYRADTLPLRWLWVRRKADAVALAERVSRFQTRRIGKEVVELAE